MTWLNPLAFLGLLAIAVPVLIHLFGRPRAKRILFPTLRFIELTRDTPARRTIPNDLLLLLVRSLALAAVVSALARPAWRGVEDTTRERDLSRAVIVDTSASMSRLTSTGERWVDVALRDGRQLVADASTSMLIPTVRPGDAMRGAAAWLGRQSGSREIVVLSDFQLASLLPAEAAAIDSMIGLDLRRTGPVAADSTVTVVIESAGREVAATAAIRGATTQTRWRVTSATRSRARRDPVLILAGADERIAAEAALTVAREAATGLAIDSNRTVVMVLPSATARGTLLASVTSPEHAWQGDVLFRVSRNLLLAEVALAAPTDASRMPDAVGLVPVARTRDGRTVVIAGAVTLEGRPAIALFPAPGAPPMLWAAALSAAFDAVGESPAAVAERDARTLSDATLRSLSRPGMASASTAAALPLARWFWTLALLLLGVEWVLRRGARSPGPQSVEAVGHERVA